MLEFGARIVLAGLTVLFAGATGVIGLPLAIGVGLAVGLLALAAHALDSHKLYDGAGAGLHAGLEGLAIALLMVGAGCAESLGFFVLVPYAWVAARRAAPWTPGAFAGAFSLVGANALIHSSEPNGALMLQASGVLGLGLLLALRPQTSVADAPVASAEQADLQGRLRALREAYSVLERRSSDDVHTAALARCNTPEEMAQALRDATGATGSVLFTPADQGWSPSGMAGHVPEELQGAFPNGHALQETGAVLLFVSGRPVGAVWLPQESRRGLAALVDTLKTRLADRLEAQIERRNREAAELRLSLLEGGDSPDAVARALAELVGADSVEFGAIGPQGAMPLGRFGSPCALPEALRHETGTGLNGWAAAGGPMLWISDARDDERVDRAKALRARTAALALVSLADGRAYAWAAWHTVGVGRPSSLAAIRASEGVVLRWLDRARGRVAVGAGRG